MLDTPSYILNKFSNVCHARFIRSKYVAASFFLSFSFLSIPSSYTQTFFLFFSFFALFYFSQCAKNERKRRKLILALTFTHQLCVHFICSYFVPFFKHQSNSLRQFLCIFMLVLIFLLIALYLLLYCSSHRLLPSNLSCSEMRVKWWRFFSLSLSFFFFRCLTNFLLQQFLTL